MFELIQVMRQREDKAFANILNRVREGKHTDNDIDVLKQQMLKLSPDHPDYPMIATHLFSTNVSVDEHNDEIFKKSTNEKVQIKAIDIVLGDLSDKLKERLKKKFQMIQPKQWVYIQYVEFSRKQNTTLRRMFQLQMV
jgi:hypothetical protein